jgi:16S rRNA (guanine527-N7)-methyltransferase
MSPHHEEVPGGDERIDRHGHLEEVPVVRRAVLLDVLSESRARGLVGPAQLRDQVEHSLAFAREVRGVSRVADLGSGGGLPGLVVAEACPEVEIVLIDAAARRCRFLEWAVARLEVGGRVTVVHARAEEVGRRQGFREGFDAVVARSFAAPGVTAECARGLLRPGGRLVVSDPPTGGDRWDVAGLASLGLRRVARHGESGTSADVVQLTVLEAVGPCPEQFPRRTGVPSRRPVF